jgi:Leucine-rich repeat (LRR) protein
LSSQNLTQLDEDDILSFPASNEIRQLYLASNCLTMIPTITVQLSFLTALDLSKNNIGIPLSHPLEFTKLRELHLNGNKIQSLHEITSLLSTPKLTHLDVSTNRISGSLPNLRDFFPELLRFVAADNSISEVPAESLQGLKMVNLSNNEIGRLEPSIGRYAGTLTSLEVEGNRFRVPNYAVLKKGTEAILSWLSDKIPSATEQFSDPDVSRSPSF